jgi:protein-arginine kinase activator protein McsA
MNLLYDALQNELSGAIFDQTPTFEKQEALNSMIQYFQDREEYEKCAVLRDMVLTIE